jgi:hypothetical protein
MVDQASPDTDTPDPSNGVSASAGDTAPVPGAIANDDLLGELARAMHQAATSQYERLNGDLAQRRAQQVETISAHADAEIEGLKAASEADVQAIDAWAKAETEKIKLERLRRIDARREQLAAQLERQETIKQRQVFAIEVAIDAHRNEVDLFFGRMERETDPSAIARIAATMPAFPSLADVADEAGRSAAAEFAGLDRSAEATAAVDSAVTETDPAAAATASDETATDAVAEATTVDPAEVEDESSERAAAALESDPAANVTESRLMAVMDPDAVAGTAEDARPWEAPYAVSVAAGSGEGEPEPASKVGSTLLRTVRAIRPMSGERHDRGNEER